MPRVWWIAGLCASVSGQRECKSGVMAENINTHLEEQQCLMKFLLSLLSLARRYRMQSTEDNNYGRKKGRKKAIRFIKCSMVTLDMQNIT